RQASVTDNSDDELVFRTTGETVTALRLEISQEQKNNFVLSQIKATWKPDNAQPKKGRFVRMTVPGKKRLINMAEIEIFSGDNNLTKGATAKQSSTGFGGTVDRIIDGNTDGEYKNNSVSHTAIEDNPWVEVDLGSVQVIDSIKLWGRTDTPANRHDGYTLEILGEDRQVVWSSTPSNVPAPSSNFAFGGEEDITFKLATASYEQKGFPASTVISDKISDATGWAVAGKTGQPVELSLVLGEPKKLTSGTLKLRLSQQSKYKKHLLTNFRVSTTTTANITHWARIPANIAASLHKPNPTEPEMAAIAKYHRTIAPALRDQRAKLAEVEKSLKALKPHTNVPIMQELPKDQHRETHVQIRGAYTSLGEKVSMATPAAFHPMKDDQPRNRLGLAKWIVDSDNPLTARVIVNRFWAQLFGKGLVKTSEEFGSQGELPTHPELLDYLAIDLQEDWDIKRFLKQVIMSSTYQQQSIANDALLEADPFNDYLARGPRFRITAEMVRDQA
ncbi:MAG: DUF1553 domain-containing protein, partial [Verrucomicrobiota bacterium]